jgi:hypothetical protein
MTKGYTYVKVTAAHPEVDEFEAFKEYFGCDLKGRYVKCQMSLDELAQGVADALINVKYSEDSDYLYKLNVTEVVKTLKEVTGAKQCSTMGVYEHTPAVVQEEEETEDSKPVPKSAPKKAPVKKTTGKSVKEEQEEQEEQEEEEQEEEPVKPVAKSAAKPVAKPAAKPVAKGPAKPAARQSVVVDEEEEEEEEQEIVPVPKSTGKSAAKPVSKPVAKVPAKPAGKKQSIAVEDDGEEEEVVVQTKNIKTQPKAGSKTQIHLSDDEEEA